MIGRPSISRLITRRRPVPSCNHNIRSPQIVGHFSIDDRHRILCPPSISVSAFATLHRSRWFSHSSIHRDDSQFVNHYEILKVTPTATKAELKKQFYALSKETHPDRHPNDPTAGERFSQVSESYSILADEEKRRRYDRDFSRVHGGNRDRAGGTPGSYAGSRPASGLSKRRGTFRGPPPSFYAQGGYGSSNNSASSSSAQQQQQQTYQGGMFNSQAFQDKANSEYDPSGTFKTQSNEDVKRMQRRAAQFRAMQAEIDALNDSDFWGRFVIVTFVVALGVTVGSIIVNMSHSPRGGLTRGDGSKRGGQSNDWAKS